jgi:hypothetical protein
MNKILLSVFAVLATLSLAAQTTITNGDFATWTGSGATIEPTQWNSTKTAGGTFGSFAIQTLWQESTIKHSAPYSAKLVTGNTLGNNVNGALTTGRVMVPSTTPAEGFIQTVTNDNNYKMTFTGRPDSLVFWYQYTPVGGDYPSVEARIHVNGCEAPETPVNNNHPNDTANIVARAQWAGANATVATWTRVAVPFVYRNGTTPQYILITSTSSATTAGAQQNSTLYLDDFDVIYNPTIATGTVSPLAYYVSSTQGASISVPYTVTGTFGGANTITAQLSDASGSFASPVTIGSVSSGVSGTISATIPAGTATGTGYRVRVVSSSPVLTAAANASDISITLVTNSVAPYTAQTIGAGANGTALTVTETPAATAREWKYSTVSGSGYQSFGTAQTGTSYTPNFASAGTYYVVCESTFPGGLVVSTAEVVINVVSNSIAPTSSQSILVGVNGNPLTVTETPAGSWREWLYSTTQGGPYVSFVPAITGATSYTPNFSSAGNYYVVCNSDINGVFVYSNEVLISVGSATITTGTVAGSPFLFSPNATDASVSVPFTTSGTFNAGNIFTAQLSDANGSFAAATNLGTLTAVSSGTISATIPHTTPAGTGYRVRVISSNPVVLGGDNGVDLVVDQFNNSIAPVTTQTIMHGANGTAISVTASQTSTQEWKYSTTSGSGYQSFGTAETGSSYTPNFAIPGNYYVVAVSKNSYNDEVTSNEVWIVVTNGTSITTSAVSGSPFDVSPNMAATVSVNFTSDVVFNAGNTFTAQLSDYNGSFASPLNIGTLSGATIGAINALIPGATAGGSAYRIRVVSSDPAVTGSDNGTDLVVNPFSIAIAPMDTQHLHPQQSGTAIAATTSQSATYSWQFSEVQGSFYAAFNPPQTGSTYTPVFNLPSTYYVICKATNGASDEVATNEVVIVVTTTIGINETGNDFIKTYWNGNNLVVDLTSSTLVEPTLELTNTTGQVVLSEKLNGSSLNSIGTSLNSGMYFFRILDGGKAYSGKTSKK